MADISNSSHPVSKSITQVFSQSSRLTRLSGLSTYDNGDNYREACLHISWETFVALADAAGPVLDTLEDVYIIADAYGRKPRNPCIFDRFLVLRSLRCHMDVNFKRTKDGVSPHILSSLVSLKMLLCKPSFLEVLCCMQCVISKFRFC